MWQKLVTATISALLIVIPLANGLYFHIAETERKCFIEEIPDETMVTGTKKFLSKSFLIIHISCYFTAPVFFYGIKYEESIKSSSK